MLGEKAENKNIRQVSYTFDSKTGRNFAKMLDEMDELEHDFKLNRAYLDADQDSLKKLTELRGYDAAHLQQQNLALAEEFMAGCGQRERCMIYAKVNNVLIDNSDVSSLIKLLQDRGYTVTPK